MLEEPTQREANRRENRSSSSGWSSGQVVQQIVADTAMQRDIGIELDHARNSASEPIISSDASGVDVRVIRTDEELMIAKAVQQVMKTSPTPGGANARDVL